MKTAFIFLAALLLPSSPATAVNWHNLQSTPQLLLQADDPELEESEAKPQDKAKKKDKKLRVWSKITHARPELARPGDFFYSSAKYRLAINCTQRTHKLLQKLYYNAEGQEIKFVHHGEEERTETIVPESHEEQISDFACSFKPAKPNSLTPKPVPRKPSSAAGEPVNDQAAPPDQAAQKTRKKTSISKRKTAPDKSKECEEPKAKAEPKPPVSKPKAQTKA